MKHALLTAALIAAVLPRPLVAETTDEQAIKALEQQFADAFNKKDVNAIMAVYSDDVFVFDVVPPRQYVGAKAYRQDWEQLFKLFNANPKFDISDLAITTDGDLGFSHSIQRVQATMVKGDPLDLTVRVTDAYRKINGQWKIVQEHVSVPVNLETQKPDLHSSP
jgi:uncharacterized protein (TIGR02246 family)